MRTLFFTLVCLLAFSVNAADVKAEYTQERIVELPQDGGRWYLTLFGDSADPQYQMLRSWLQTHNGLSTLRSQVHYNDYLTTSPRYPRYAESMPGLPCIRLQNSRGTVISEFWSNNIPLTGEALFSSIKGDLRSKASWGLLRQRRGPQPRRCRPSPQPTPAPTPAPAPVDTPPVFDEPEDAPEESGFPWLLALAAAIIGIGVGVGQGYKREHMDSSNSGSKL